MTPDAILSHPAFAPHALLGTQGYALPAGPFERHAVTEEALPALRTAGIEVRGPLGTDNEIHLSPGMPPVKLAVTFGNFAGNRLLVAAHSRLRGGVDFEGSHHLVVTAGGKAANPNEIHAKLRGERAGLFVGAGMTSGGTKVWIEDVGVLVGEDCMASWGVYLRATDTHGIVDLRARRAINPPGPVVLGRHVWLGQDVIVMPRVTVGDGAVLGARAVVTRDVPPCCVAVGSPARVVRREVSWTRKSRPSAAAIEALLREPFVAAALDQGKPAPPDEL